MRPSYYTFNLCFLGSTAYMLLWKHARVKILIKHRSWSLNWQFHLKKSKMLLFREDLARLSVNFPVKCFSVIYFVFLRRMSPISKYNFVSKVHSFLRNHHKFATLTFRFPSFQKPWEISQWGLKWILFSLRRNSSKTAKTDIDFDNENTNLKCHVSLRFIILSKRKVTQFHF